MISGVVAEDEDKSTADMSLVFNDIAHVALDVFLELLRLGIAIAPLRRVAVSSHLLPRVGEDSKKGINIGVCRGADGQNNYEL